MPRHVTLLAVVLGMATLLAGCGNPATSDVASQPITFERRAALDVSRKASAPSASEPVFACPLAPNATDSRQETTTQHAAHAQAPDAARAPVEPSSTAGHDLHGTGGAPSPTPPARPAAAPAGHHGEAGCQPTEEQARAAQKLVDETRAGIARFADTNAATLAGYQPDNVQTTAYWNYVHYVNWNEVNSDTVLDPSRPESLLYGQTDNNGWVLIGAMYVMPRAGMPGPAVGGCLTNWHADPAWNGKDSPEMLHVWTVDMPGGHFTDNPDRAYIRQL